MWFMTLLAGLLYRLVDVLLLKTILLVFVAAKTQLNPVHYQEEFILGGMGIVTYNAITGGNRSVNILLCGNVILVTDKAKIGKRFFLEKKLIVRLMGIMADDALPLFNRNMACLAL